MPRTLSRYVAPALVAVMVASAADDVAAKTLAVAVNGTDDATCGGKTTPCRSIARAIANAAAGDSIVVGPGRYGDLDGDGVLGEAGEEPAVGTYMVLIDKPLSVTSRDGAAATVIDGGPASGRDLVLILADGVVFGKPKKGFTLQNGVDYFGVLVNAPTGGGIVVAGNRVRNTAFGLGGSAPGALFTGNQASDNETTGFYFGGAGIRMVGNEAIGSGLYGLLLGMGSGGAQIIGNTFIGNGAQGAQIDVGNVLVRGNVANGNAGSGFGVETNLLTGTGNVTFTGNVASANGGAGFFLSGTGITVTKNTAYANLASGVDITVFSSTVSVTGNNLAGNDLASGLRCGTSKAIAQAVDATSNFWGAPTGPGPAPADQACDVTGFGNLTTTPFATKEIKVKPKPPKLLF